MKIFVINPGSTSTKFSLYENENEVWKTTVHHPAEELATFRHANDQLDYRDQAMHLSLIHISEPTRPY